MRIEIRRLTPELADEYLRFFDETPHSTGKKEDKCYCVCWASTATKAEECSTAEKRRAVAKRYVETGLLQGYLAFSDREVVGWCNANTKSNCYQSLSWRMFMGLVAKDDKKVKSVFCFSISPSYRGKGLATALLNHVCDDARREGFDFVEAYPNEKFADTEKDFMGPRKMFEQEGFVACYEAEGRIVMRKRLF